ncbi:MAG: type II toxin-antitoxin system VapC family toxin [Pseudomonadota bacterium]|nr:type II toxin-antitoxin system VapC family toxin [Pseudomonadota bacterium]
MRVLVDTNGLLFALLAPERLSPRARRILEHRGSALVWSAASTWEVVVKARLGKLDLGGDVATVLGEQILRMGMRILPVEQAHSFRVATLRDVDRIDADGSSRRHADPFDRLLVAQALVEGLPILTSDDQFDRYPVERVW